MRLLLAFVFLLPSVAFSQGYVGVDAFMWAYDEDGAEEASATGIRGRMGMQVNEHLSVEAHLATGGSDTVFVSIPGCCSGNVDVELDYLISAVLRPQYPLSQSFNVYGLIGVTTAQLTVSSGGLSASDDDTGLSVGLGAEVGVTERAWISGDFTSYLGDDEYNFSAFSLGARFAF